MQREREREREREKLRRELTLSRWYLGLSIIQGKANRRRSDGSAERATKSLHCQFRGRRVKQIQAIEALKRPLRQAQMFAEKER